MFPNVMSKKGVKFLPIISKNEDVTDAKIVHSINISNEKVRAIRNWPLAIEWSCSRIVKFKNLSGSCHRAHMTLPSIFMVLFATFKVKRFCGIPRRTRE